MGSISFIRQELLTQVYRDLFASLDRKENRLLLNQESSATYASGFLLYLRGSALVA
jgi:hypothetical protein